MKYNTIDEVYEAKRNGEIDTEEFWCLIDAFNNAVELDDEANKLMDMLNDEQDPAIQEFAKARCKFLGWNIERVYDPADYYSDDSGYVWCITGVNYL